MPKAISYAPTDSHTSAQGEPGHLIEDASGNQYRYVLAEDAAIADGDVVEYADATGYEVTNDRAGGSSIGRAVAGVAVGAIADGSYGYILVRGIHTNMKTDGGVSAGEQLIPHATADGQADTFADGLEEQVFGVALADDDASSPSRVTARVNCI